MNAIATLSADQADHLSLNLALNAQIALNLLPIIEAPPRSTWRATSISPKYSTLK